jgi:hypothetical protein
MNCIFSRITILSLAYLTAFAGCAAPRAGMFVQDGSTVFDIHAKVVAVDPQGRSISADPKGLMLLFPSISGQIDGEFKSKPMQSVPAAIGSEFSLDLSDLALHIREVSAPLANNPQTQGLLVTPPSARFARVATIAVDAATGKIVGGASFIEPVSRNIMVLVYADRPCSITGSTRLEGKNFKHEIRLNHPGFHWIRYHRLGKDNFILKEYIAAAGSVQFLIRQTEQRSRV